MPTASAAAVTNLATVEQRYRQFAHEYLTGGVNASKGYRRVYDKSANDRPAVPAPAASRRPDDATTKTRNPAAPALTGEQR